MPMPAKYTHRIRRCEGNKAAWLLVALDDSGNERTSYGTYTTAMTIDDLLRFSRGLLPDAEDVVQIIYYAGNEDNDDTKHS